MVCWGVSAPDREVISGIEYDFGRVRSVGLNISETPVFDLRAYAGVVRVVDRCIS